MAFCRVYIKKDLRNQLAATNATLNQLQNQLDASNATINNLTSSKRTNINELQKDIKSIQNTLIFITKNFEKEQADIDSNLDKLTDFTNDAKEMSLVMKRLHAILELAKTDSADIIGMIDLINNFDSNWGTKANLNDSQKNLMVAEHSQIVAEYNRHQVHARKLSKQVSDTSLHTESFTIGANTKTGDILHNETFHLKDVLSAIAKEINKITAINERLFESSKTILTATKSVQQFAAQINTNAQNLITRVDQIEKASKQIKKIDAGMAKIHDDLQNIHDIGKTHEHVINPGFSDHNTWRPKANVPPTSWQP